YFRAVGLVTLWGLLFVLVLTMISGARELMTPGAWEPGGVTYRLATKPVPAVPAPSADEPRRRQLTLLKEALWQYARGHKGRFPPSSTDPAISRQRWQLPDDSGMEYVYAGGTVTPLDGVPLTYEPEVYPDGRWVLFSDGEVRRLPSDELVRLLAAGKK